VTDWQDVGIVKRQLQAVLDSTGACELQFGVRHAHERWLIDSVVLATSQPDDQQPWPTVIGYLGADGSRAHRAFHSVNGNKDTLTGKFGMDDGNDLFVSYAGGIPGTIATVTIEGASQEEV
jgi:hypothetical protein